MSQSISKVPGAQKDKVPPESAAGPVSRLLFLWVVPFVRDAWDAVKEKRFNADVLPPIPQEEFPSHNVKTLRELWDKERAKGKSASLMMACLKMMGPKLALCLFMMNFQALVLMSGPVLVSQLITCIQGDNPPEYGYFMCLLMAISTASASLIQQGSWHICARTARQCYLALTGLIFEKPARLSSFGRSDLTEGEMVNMLAVDAQQVLQFVQFFAIFASAPMYLLVPSIIILVLLGWPYLIGLVIFGLSSVICDRIAVQVKNCQAAKLKAADARNKRLNEAFQGIRTVKLNGWEGLMEERVEVGRSEEIATLKKYHVWQSLQQAISFGMPTLGVVITFLIYAAMGGEFEPANVFLCVGLFEYLTLGSNILPHMFNMVRQLRQNMQRMQKLLQKEEDFERSDGKGLPTGSVACSEADFAWSTKNDAIPTLVGVSLHAHPGEMVAITGRVGSGKSTCAGGLLGLVSRTRGTTAVSGSVAYVTQSPQILNDTIRENILFGLPLDQAWYDKVIEACALASDLKQFAAGDATEIGERGITISGGQKQRVAIARAAYSRADVMVFDDPLSAMDAHVGKVVFDGCFRSLLAGKTRIFFTNQLHFCSSCSQVIMLDEGKVVDSGSYRELVSASPPGPFASFLESVVGGAHGDEDHDEAEAEPVDAKDITLEAKEENEKKPDASKPAEKAAPAAPGGKPADGKTIVAEKKMTGRIGLSDWMQVARASNAAVVGALVLVFSIGAPAAQYLVNAILAIWTDTLIEASDPDQGAFDNPVPAILYVASAFALAGVLFGRGLICVIYFLRSSKVLHRAMLANTLRQSMGWFDTTPVGRVLARFGNDVQFLDIFLPMLFQMWSLLFFRVLVVIVVAGITAPPALLLSVLILIAARLVYTRYASIQLEVTRVQLMSLAPLLAAQSSFLHALDSIRCYNRVDTFINRFETMQTSFIKTFYWSLTLDRAVQCLFATFGVSIFFGGVGALLLTLSVYDTPLSSMVSPGSAGAILAFCSILAFQAPVALFMTTRIEAMLAAVQRVAEYKDQPTEESTQAVREPVPTSWPTKGVLSLENVEMRYQEHLPLALKSVSFNVRPGEKVGIVGRTGSGKSSIILTCFRMINPCGGTVSIDGRDVGRVGLQDLRGRLGVIPQDSWLFSGTVRSNLDVFGRYSDEEIWEAIRNVRLESVAKGWEKGLGHEIQEKGENLSMGTAQLLCLARVLLKKPKLLFMDEATASVDAETDKLVQETIRKEGVLPADCAIVTVAHRLHTVIDYDRVVVLAEGKVLEDDSPAKLLDIEDGHLSKLVNSTGRASARELRRRASATIGADPGMMVSVGECSTSPSLPPPAGEDGASERVAAKADAKVGEAQSLPPPVAAIGTPSSSESGQQEQQQQHQPRSSPQAIASAARAFGGCFVGTATERQGALPGGCFVGVRTAKGP